jgi:hypothetical protein
MLKSELNHFINEIIQQEASKIAEPKRSGLSVDQLELKPHGGVENIIKVYNQATSEEKSYWGRWYHNAKSDVEDLARQFNLPFPVVAGIVAVLSPGNKWSMNLLAAEKLLQGQTKINAYPRQVQKALRILETGDTGLVSGPKVTVFFNSLMNPKLVEKDMVLDGHAINIWRGEKTSLKGIVNPSGKERARMIQDYQMAANELGVPVQAVQAVTWYIWKYTGKTPPLEAPTGVYDVSKFRNSQPANDTVLDESRAAAAVATLQKAGKFDVADRFLSNFQTVSTKFIPWIIKILPNIDPSQDSDVLDALADFEKATKNNQLKEKDINQYPSFSALVSALQNVGLSRTKEKEEVKKTGAVTLFKDERFTIIEPTSLDACRLYGKGTKWCIAGKNAGFYKNVVYQGMRFLFIYDSENSDPQLEKVAIGFNPEIPGSLFATAANDEAIPKQAITYLWSDNSILRVLNNIVGINNKIFIDPDMENTIDEVNAIGAGGIVGAGMGNGGTVASKKLMWSGDQPLKETFYHGTSTAVGLKPGVDLLPPDQTDKISEKGRKKNLDKVFFTKDIGSAKIYAGRAVNQFGGQPVVFKVTPVGKIEALNLTPGSTVFMSPKASIEERLLENSILEDKFTSAITEKIMKKITKFTSST